MEKCGTVRPHYAWTCASTFFWIAPVWCFYNRRNIKMMLLHWVIFMLELFYALSLDNAREFMPYRVIAPVLSRACLTLSMIWLTVYQFKLFDVVPYKRILSLGPRQKEAVYGLVAILGTLLLSCVTQLYSDKVFYLSISLLCMYSIYGLMGFHDSSLRNPYLFRISLIMMTLFYLYALCAPTPQACNQLLLFTLVKNIIVPLSISCMINSWDNLNIVYDRLG